MGTCWFCNEKLIWGNDFTLDDWGFEGEGMVAVCTCSGCGAEAIFRVRDDEL